MTLRERFDAAWSRTYAVEFVDIGMIKIGRSRHIRKRLARIRGAALLRFGAKKSRVLGIVVGNQERELLIAMTDFLVDGREWFRATPASRRRLRREMSRYERAPALVRR